MYKFRLILSAGIILNLGWPSSVMPTCSSYMCYPNPFLVETTIKYNGAFKYSIYTINGTEVESGNGENEIVVGRNLLKGFYIIHIQSAHESIQLKVIKE